MREEAAAALAPEDHVLNKNTEVTPIARFLLERGLAFRDLGVCGHENFDMDSDLSASTCTESLSRIYPEGLAAISPKTKDMTRMHCQWSVITDLT